MLCWLAGPQTHSSTGTVRFDKLAGTARSSTDTHTQTALNIHSSLRVTLRARALTQVVQIREYPPNKQSSDTALLQQTPKYAVGCEGTPCMSKCCVAAATLLQCQASSRTTNTCYVYTKTCCLLHAWHARNTTLKQAKTQQECPPGANAACNASTCNASAPKWLLLHGWLQLRKPLDSCQLLQLPLALCAGMLLLPLLLPLEDGVCSCLDGVLVLALAAGQLLRKHNKADLVGVRDVQHLLHLLA